MLDVAVFVAGIKRERLVADIKAKLYRVSYSEFESLNNRFYASGSIDYLANKILHEYEQLMLEKEKH